MWFEDPVSRIHIYPPETIHAVFPANSREPSHISVARAHELSNYRRHAGIVSQATGNLRGLLRSKDTVTTPARTHRLARPRTWPILHQSSLAGRMHVIPDPCDSGLVRDPVENILLVILPKEEDAIYRPRATPWKYGWLSSPLHNSSTVGSALLLSKYQCVRVKCPTVSRRAQTLFETIEVC